MAVPAELQKWIDVRLERVKEEIAFRMEAEAVRLVPVDTGNLKLSITSGVKGNQIWVGAGFHEDVNYAAHVEYGTKPHIIRPKNKKALAFKGSKGEDVVVKKVNIPRIRPQPFLRPALFMVEKQIPAIVKKHFSQ